MIITVLWEDQRGAEAKGFGPHELMLSCVADELNCARDTLKDLIKSHPKKGNANVRAAIQRDIVRLADTGPVFAVVDRDKIRQLWKAPNRPADCMSSVGQQFRQDAPGDYDLVFLVDNVESLIKAACAAFGDSYPDSKPGPDLRDRLLGRAAWAPSQSPRSAIRTQCPSFNRLVGRLSAHVGARQTSTD
jgi:hypothetical protein